MSESGSLATDAIVGDTIDGPSIKRDSDIWFEDGNVVVIAQTTAFRFHKSVVSLHSSVFRDLFSIPQPSLVGEELESFDGCPVVHVSDTSYDFRELIRAIYCGVSYLHPDQLVTFPVLAALARLSHKYQLDHLLAAAIHRLKDTFTTQLDIWDRRRGIGGEHFLPNRFCPEVIEAINLFRLLDRPEMLPAAFCLCAQLRPASILGGTVRADGVTRERLSPSDTALCFQVKEELWRATACLLAGICEACNARIVEISSNRGQQCTGRGPAVCVEGLRAVMAKSLRDTRECIDADPFDVYLVSPAENAPLTGEVCRACGDVLKATYTRQRTKIWRSLPTLVGVEVADWDSA